MKKPIQEGEEYGAEESARRRDATLKAMLKTPHRKQKDEPPKRPKSSKRRSENGGA